MNNLRKPETRLIAVIDIGSNSVRLVVYRGLKRTPDIVFNERVLCGLGAGIQSQGRMADFAISQALETLERTCHLIARAIARQVAENCRHGAGSPPH